MTAKNKHIIINYTNWKNATTDRVIVPEKIWFGKTRWYKEEQWFMTAYDTNKEATREFSLTGINSISEALPSRAEAVVNGGDMSTVSHQNEVKLFTDGGSRGNPGPSAIGYVILDMDDVILQKNSKYLGITTNNQAEYQGLKEGLELCRTLNIQKVHIYMDSLLVVNQMKGLYKVKNRDLWPIYESLQGLVKHFKEVSFTHVPRELNKIADGMVNECLDTQIE